MITKNTFMIQSDYLLGYPARKLTTYCIPNKTITIINYIKEI